MRSGELVLLTNKKKGSQHLLTISEGPIKVPGLGVLDCSKLLEKDFGGTHSIGSTEFLLTKPSLPEIIPLLKRKAQVINQKDIPQILFLGDIANADLVIEGGVGSGFLTCSMAMTIKPEGKVITYELRQDFADFAQQNIDLLGLTDRVSIKVGDITSGIEERNADVVVIDIPIPQDCVGPAWEALRPGGIFISYVPNISQMESCSKAMKEQGFKEIRSFETLLRDMVVGEQGTRPDFSMLGHTGYLTYGYKR